MGIRPAEPGYRAITLQPQLIHGITQACALRITPYGRVRLAWQCLNHLITVEVEIPANTTAQLFLPEQEAPSRWAAAAISIPTPLKPI